MTMTRNDPAVPAPAGDLRASSSVEQSEAAHKRGSSHADLRRPPGKKKRRKRRKRKRSRPGRRPGTEQGAGGGSRPTSRPACASWRALCSRGLEHRARTQLGDEDQDVRLNMLAVADMTRTGSRWRSQIGFGFVLLLKPPLAGSFISLECVICNSITKCRCPMPKKTAIAFGGRGRKDCGPQEECVY
jgi:hypothetical protein